MFHIKRYMTSFKIVMDSRFNNIKKDEVNKKLKVFNLQLAEIDFELLKKSSSSIVKDQFSPIEIFIYKNKKYVHLRPPKPPRLKNNEIINFEKQEDLKRFFKFKKEPILFLDLFNESNIKFFWFILLLLIDILLAWFYYFLYKRLKPLIKLKDEITKFSNGDLNINTKVKGKDEIAQVSNEFNNAISKIRDLNDSRKLFLRNILHELKTPITKGKLISDTLDDSRKKEILQKAFSRLEYLLGEFIKLEELTSGKMNLSRKEYRVIDLLDQAIDILLINKDKLEIYSNATKVNVDFEIFSIALKNLLDNALRYNTNGQVEIFVKEDSLLIKNMGEPLKKEFESYLKPFSREYESIDKGLGLGLYITNNVIESHGYKLYYSYSGNYHLFKIQFKIDTE